jgi:hypothetical protein
MEHSRFLVDGSLDVLLGPLDCGMRILESSLFVIARSNATKQSLDYET